MGMKISEDQPEFKAVENEVTVFRRLLLDPLFSGLPESIFHADRQPGIS